MVGNRDAFARRLGVAMVTAAFWGAGVSLVSVAALAVLGRLEQPWPLSFSPWWAGDHAWLRLLAGAGILLLAAVPLLMLLAVAVHSIRKRKLADLGVAAALVLILTLAVVLAAAGPL